MNVNRNEREYSYRRTPGGYRIQCSVPGCRDYQVVVMGHELESCYMHASQGLSGKSTREEMKTAKNRRNRANRRERGRPSGPLSKDIRGKKGRRKRKPAVSARTTSTSFCTS